MRCTALTGQGFSPNSGFPSPFVLHFMTLFSSGFLACCAAAVVLFYQALWLLNNPNFAVVPKRQDWCGCHTP